jgi:hypothetical protein
MACEKTVSGPGPHPVQPCLWHTDFILVDSNNQQLFFQYSEVPFDYARAYYVNGLGDTNKIYTKLDETNGVVFKLSELCSELKREMELIGDTVHTWKLYPVPNREPDTYKANVFTKADYFESVNGDTVNKFYTNKEIIKIKY